MIAIIPTYEARTDTPEAKEGSAGPFSAKLGNVWIDESLHLDNWQSRAARFVSIEDTVAAVCIIRDQEGLDGEVFQVYRDAKYPQGKMGKMVHVGQVLC